MATTLRLVALLAVAAACWGGAHTSAGTVDLKGCFLGSKVEIDNPAISQIVGQRYIVDRDAKRYSICVCCNTTLRDTNISAEVEPIAGGVMPTVYGRRNCSHFAGTNRWFMLEYHGGDNYAQNESCAHGIAGTRSTKLVATCNSPTSRASLSVVQADNCSLLLEMQTPLLCPAPSPLLVSGLSHGSVFCILFGTVLGIYLLVGVCYRRLLLGAKGIDQLPNKDFWVNLGHLQADGCNLVCRRGEPPIGRGTVRSDGWQQIAGGSFTDSDRDDAPLQP